jgi:hypothetical protein
MAMKKLLLTGIAALFLATGAAHATEDFCAVVLKNRDGWLALRKGPGTRFKMITKLLEGDFLLADTGGGDTKWTRVDGADPPYSRGFVRSKYIQEFTCPEDQEMQGDSRKRQELPLR